MTLYWWNHWFWITVVSVFATLPFTSVATYPISSPSLEQIEDTRSSNQNDNKHSKLPLEFPLPAQTDVDDIFTGSENIPRTLFIKEEIIEKLNNGKDETPSAISSPSSSSSSSSITSTSSSSSSDQEKSAIENQLSDRSIKDVDQSIEHQKHQINYDESGKTENQNSNNDNSNLNSSKSVIELIPKVINQEKINEKNNEKELDSFGSESGMSSLPLSSLNLQNIKNQTESLDVVSFENSNNTNNSNVSNISTNISLGEKSQLKTITTLSPSTTTRISASTEAYHESVSNIMQVKKNSSSIRIKSISNISSSSSSSSINGNESISAFADGLDETTTGTDTISMTTILHPVNNYSDNSETTDSEISKLENRSDEMTGRIPVTLENVTKLSEKSLSKETERSRKSKGLSSEYRDAFLNNYASDAKNLLTRSAGQEEDFNEKNRIDDNGGNVSSEALQRAYVMDAGTISGICLSVLAICCGVGTVGIVLYRRRFLNKPQALSEPDSSVYIDDSTIRDNSDEMYSLDNDSFLNSLEAMTIQNYWTDTVKHTKL